MERFRLSEPGMLRTKAWKSLMVMAVLAGAMGEVNAFSLFGESGSFLRCDSRMWHCRWYNDSGITEHQRPIFSRSLRESEPAVAAIYSDLNYDRIMQKGGLVPSSTAVEYFGCNRIREVVAGVVYVVGHKCWLIDSVDDADWFSWF